MERISATAVFCVALIVGIILQAPPQVYKNFMGYYDSFNKPRVSAPATTTPVQPASKKVRNRKPARPRVEKIEAASFFGEEPTVQQNEQSIEPTADAAEQPSISESTRTD